MKLGKIAAVAVASAMAVSTFSVASPASAVQNIVVWADKGTIDTIKTKVQAWDTANADYTVTLVQKDFSTVRDALKVAVPKGQGPDILAGAAHDWVGNLVKANVLLPIDAQLPANFKDDFVGGALQAMKYNGHYYGVPGWTENIAFLRNVKKQKTRITSINQVKNGEIGINYSATTSDPYHFYPFQTMFDAPVFTMDGGGDWTETVGMGGTKGANFAKWLKSKGTAFFGKPADAKILCNFLNGKIKYWISGPWQIKNIQEGAAACKTGLKYGSGYAIDSFPVGPTGIKGVPFLGAKGAFMTNSPNTDVVTSTQLLNFLAGKEAGIAYFNAEYAAPANKAALAVASNDAAIKAFAAVGKGVLAMPNIVAMDSVWDKWGKTEAKIVTGKSTNPAADWKTMTSAITALTKG